jgi:hypothetical protein
VSYIIVSGVSFLLGMAFAGWQSVKFIRKMTADARALSERMRKSVEEARLS